MNRRRIISDESGAVVVIGALAILFFAVFGAALIEVGQWFQHRRTLQVRTDAAALAAGQALNACFNIGTASFPLEADADAYIESWALNYGGFASSATTQTGAPYNKQWGTGSSRMTFQSDAPPPASGPAPTRNLGPECFGDGNPTHTNPSNVNLMADVRTTQSGILPFFSFSPFATTHGWARVQLQTIKSARPAMPLAIPDINPKHVAVTLVDNTTGHALTCPSAPISPCTWPLAGPTSAGTLNSWAAPVTLTMPAAGSNVGVRVSVGPVNGDCSVDAPSTVTYSCYDYTSNSGVLAIRSYSTAAVGGSGTPALLRGVTPTTCLQGNLAGGTPYFSPYQSVSGTCDKVGVSAVVDFPTGATNTNVTYTIVSGGCPNENKINSPMTQTGTTWASNLTSLATGLGIRNICMAWSYGNGGSAPHGVFNGGNPVQQIFSADNASDPAKPGGPIQSAAITGVASPYALAAGSSATLNVTLGLSGGVHVNPKCGMGAGSGMSYSCSSDPTIVLRTAADSGSLNYSIDCGIIPGNPGQNNAIYQMMRFGCKNSFSINQSDLCPDTTVPAPSPTSCAPVLTGDAVGPVRDALHDRFVVGGSCLPNRYPDTSFPDDKRVVLLVDTDFSAFLGNNGSSTKSDVPVVNFATFYVTGWDTKNGDNACNTQNEPRPPNAGTGNSAVIWGHFISYEINGDPSGIKCAGDSVTPCVAALVR